MRVMQAKNSTEAEPGRVKPRTAEQEAIRQRCHEMSMMWWMEPPVLSLLSNIAMNTELDMGTLNTPSVRRNTTLTLRVCEYFLIFLRQVFTALPSQASIF
jgi:hypothetical protein